MCEVCEVCEVCARNVHEKKQTESILHAVFYRGRGGGVKEYS